MPTRSSVVARGFDWYVRRYLCRHFNAVRIVKEKAPDLPPDQSIICFGNHPGWWDPLIAALINQVYLVGRIPYIPIDQAALEKYPIFRRLGYYGIDLDSLEGAKRFLFITRALLARPTTVIWMTPGGRFCDVRCPTSFRPGLGHIAANVPHVTLLPVALEYTFWEERTPEALIAFGQPVQTQSVRRSKDEWRDELESLLASAQAKLAENAMSRDPSQFQVLLDGSAGIGGWYDAFRRLRSLVKGVRFDPRHSTMSRAER